MSQPGATLTVADGHPLTPLEPGPDGRTYAVTANASECEPETPMQWTPDAWGP